MPEFSASNIDDALDLLTIATSDGATVKGQKEIERHPERRFKAALAAYEERYGVGGNGAILIDWMVDTLSSVDVECLYFNFICLGRTRYSVLREMEKMKKEFPGTHHVVIKCSCFHAINITLTVICTRFPHHHRLAAESA